MKKGSTNYFSSMKSLTKKGILTLLMTISGWLIVNGQTYNPRHYWTFEGTNPLKDSMNNSNLNPGYFQSTYSIVPGAVKNCMRLGTGGKAIVASSGFAPDTCMTVEFLFKTANDFGITNLMSRRDNGFYIKMDYPYIQFITNVVSSTGATIKDDFIVELEGTGRGSYSYYVDGNFHHYVFKFNSKTGKKEIWIDGQCPTGFSKTAATGTFNKNGSNLSNNIVDFSNNTSYARINGDLDEVAMYTLELPASVIYKHYTEFQQDLPYSFGASNLTPPTPTAITAGVDINDYALGHPNYTTSATEQLAAFPVPRFKKGHTLLPNFNWLGMEYFASAYQPGVSNSTAVANSVAIQQELVKNYNYYLLVASNTNTYSSYNNTSTFQGAWMQLANQNPSWPTGVISFWAQINPQNAGFSSNTGYIRNKNLPTSHYLKNSAGQFLDINGNVTTNKIWSPSAPVDSFYKDGLTQKFLMQQLLNSMTRPLNLVCENGEVIPKPISTAMQNDPTVLSDKNASGLDWDTYLGNRKLKTANVYRDQFMNLPALANTKYVEYQVSGSTSRHKYSQARSINKTINGQVYATPDFYPRWSSNWLTGVSAWNGWKHMIDGRYYEIAQNDKLYSPFVAAGWDTNEERNIRPGQWLGLLKAIGMTGAEFYFTGFFNEANSYNAPNPPPAKPEGYAWQAAIPSYAQAVTSRYEDVLRNGSLLPGDVPYSVGTPNQPGYSFTAGDPRKLVVIRKHDTQNKYAIIGTIQPNSNMLGNAEIEGEAKITLNGQQMQFKIRRQGSTYIYDNTNASAPIFYQLDEWHESSHPSRWSKDFTLEAELYDNTPAAVTIKTKRPTGAAAGDFRDYTTSVSYPANATTFAPLQYTINPRSATTYYVWVRARSINGNAGGFSVSLNGNQQKSIGCITDTTFQWYSVDACTNAAVKFTGLLNQEYSLIITPNSSALEIDKMLLSINGSLNLNPNQAACNSAVATITTNGNTSFCQGGSVVLTAAPGTSYTWSNGQTTQSITASTAGNYSVTVGSNTGCNAVSTPIGVTVLARPTATIASSGANAICNGQSVNLSASAGSSYLWSNGSTTQSINVTTAGSYNVTVTGSNGCTATSSQQAITVASAPSNTLTASGPTSFCQGGSVTITAPAGNTYVWSTGVTTQQITASNSGTFSAVITNAAGCTTNSQSINVTVNSNPTVTVNNSGSSALCAGSTTQLTATGGQTYTWSNGQTGASITVSQAGNYSVVGTNTNGCTASSSVVAITTSAAPTVSIVNAGANALCAGNTTQLTATGGQTYTWSNGQTGANIIVSQAGNYSVVGTNTNGCTASSSVVAITTSAAPTVSIANAGANALCAGSTTQLTVTGGQTYTWSNGQTGASITVSQAGNYSVVGTNANGCTASSSVVAITTSAAPTVSIANAGANALCAGSTTQLTATGGQTYTWSNGQTGASITVSQAGNYSVIGTNANGCTASSSVVAITTSAAPTVSIANAGANALCAGNTTQLTATGGQTYTWSNGQTGASITVSQAGNYSVIGTNANGCTASSSVVAITTSAAPTILVSAGGPTTFCNGGSVTLTAIGGQTYSWSNGSTSSSIIVSNSGSYQVVGTNAVGCTSTSQTVAVVQNAVINSSITVNGPTSIATGQTTELVASGATNYVWQPGGQTGATLVVSSPGTYSVIASDNNGCSSTSTAVTISPITSPNNVAIINNGPISFCDGSSQVISTSGGSNLLWSPGGATTASINVTKSGVYYVYSRDINGQVISTDSVEVIVNAKPMAPWISITYVPNTAYQLTAYEPSGITYSWSNGNNTSTIVTTQPQSLTVTTTNAFGCQSSATAMTTSNVMSKTCVSPDMLTVYDITDSTTMIGWNPGVTSENFEISYWEKGTTTINQLTVNGNISSRKLSNLKPGTSYNWQVATKCATTTFPSVVYTFKTLGTPLSCGSIPHQLEAINVRMNKADLTWYNTTAQSFTVRYRNAGNTNWKLSNVSGLTNSGGTTISSLSPNTSYEWQIQSTCNGYTTPYSTSAYFTTLDTCGFLGQLSVQNIAPSTAEMKWTNLNPMSQVRIKITEVSTGYYKTVVSNSNPANGVYKIKNLKVGVTYRVEARGKCANGTLGAWTNSVTFTTTNITARLDMNDQLQLLGYPNPTTDILNFSFVSENNTDYLVKVVDMAGREVLNEIRNAEIGTNVSELNVNNYSKGMYLLFMQKGTMSSRIRFTVQ